MRLNDPAHNLRVMKIVCRERGGSCLAKAWISAHSKMPFKCSKGHRWEAMPGQVKSGRWCPDCSKNRRYTIEQMQKLAKDNGGICMSNIYQGIATPLLWSCKKGHQWRAKPQTVVRGHWCRKCSDLAWGEKNRHSIRDMHQLAKKHKGRCLSKEYVNSSTTIEWQCAEKHKFSKRPNDVQQGEWCPTCNQLNRYKTRWEEKLGECRELARKRSGLCLSNKFLGTQIKLKWKCECGNQWEAIPSSVFRGTWCPNCAGSYGERICREYFEQLLGNKFPSSFPNWLRTPEGTQLQLDGYCKKLNIAFEHQGRQHYKEISHFLKNGKTLKHRKRLDQIKRNKCIEQGVKLIEIPEIYGSLQVSKLRNFLKQQFVKLAIKIPKDFDIRIIDLDRIYVSGAKEILEEMQARARENGGHCNSANYRGSNFALEFECAEGHKFKATTAKIRDGRWCRLCGIKRRTEARMNTIEQMRRMAIERGGRCLSKEYQGSSKHLKWKCSKKHEWEAVPSSIRNGTWCPTCARETQWDGRKTTIEEIQKVARSRGGLCLSKNYINSKTPLLWQCAEEHNWKAPFPSIKDGKSRKGSWCSICSKKAAGKRRRLSIEEVHAVAAKYGGKCLSKKYINSWEPLTWKCKEGHIWKAPIVYVKDGKNKKGTWCKKCSKEQRKQKLDFGRKNAVKPGHGPKKPKKTDKTQKKTELETRRSKRDNRKTFKAN